MTQPAFTFHPTLILRTPVRSFRQAIEKETIKDCLSEPDFAESLYLASPSLHRQGQKWLRGDIKDHKEERSLMLSLARYLNRSRSRCTPFGLFAANSVLRWGEADLIQLEGRNRRTRLDMGFLRILTQQLSQHPLVRTHLHYYPNSSLYTIGNEVRYVEYQYEEERRSYQISSVIGSEDLLQVLTVCQHGMSYPEVIQCLINQHISSPDAVAFADELIEAQVLVSELEPTVTGVDPIQQGIAVLRRITRERPKETLEALITQLTAVDQELHALDQEDAEHPPTYQRIAQLVESLNLSYDSEKLFQVNLFRTVTPQTVNRRWQDDIRQAMEALTYLTSPAKNWRLEAFRQQFYGRYEAAEMPLLSVLDTETGIGYGEAGQEVSSSLIDGLVSSSYDQSSGSNQRSTATEWLLQKIRSSEKHGNEAIKIQKKEIKFLPRIDYVMPPSSSAVFRFINRKTIYLEGISGTSAANLLGRFANDDLSIAQVVKDIAQTEQENNPDAILAEIVHLPGQRVGNILRRPVLRDYEIPYLAQSTLPHDYRLALQDLYVSVREGRVVLRSQRLNREVIPRLSTAHNYARQALPVYQFLCDLQTQGVHRSLSLPWHPQQYGVQRLPRLVYGRTVLGLATWYLSKKDVQPLISENQSQQAVQRFMKQWELPRYFVLAEGDRELLVDAHNPLTVQVWIETIRKSEAILLKEFPYDPTESVVVDKQQRPYTSQCIASLIKTEKTYPSVVGPPRLSGVVRRTFTLGSPWLYYKFYSGTRSSDRILLEAVRPLTERLLEEGQIDQWFFIRYADPDDHLRVRLHLTAPDRLGEVIRQVNQYTEPFEQSGHIWKSHTDTYQREIERYGTTTMAMSEAFFFQDSRGVLETLSHTLEDNTRSQRWLSGIATIDYWLNLFGYNQTDKSRLMEKMKNSFYQEFGVDKVFKRQIDTRYRIHRDRITTVIRTGYSRNQALDEIAEGIRRQQQETPDVTLDQLVGSYVHMHLNRLISANQRLHELMIYDFLTRHYQSVLAQHQSGLTSSHPEF